MKGYVTWGEPPCDLVIETHRSTAIAVIVPKTQTFIKYFTPEIK